MAGFDVYLPVSVQVRDGVVIGAYVDWEGAPWPFLDDTANVWDVDGDDWLGSEESADRGDPERLAGGWLGRAVSIDPGDLDSLREAVEAAHGLLGSDGPLFGTARADLLDVLDVLADRAGVILDRVTL